MAQTISIVAPNMTVTGRIIRLRSIPTEPSPIKLTLMLTAAAPGFEVVDDPGEVVTDPEEVMTDTGDTPVGVDELLLQGNLS